MAAPVGALFVELRAGLARFARDMEKATKPLRSFGKTAQRVGRELSVKVSAPAALAGAAMLKTAGDFEAGMNRVAAVSGATGEQLDQLRGQAKDLGISTQFSASQAADAMGFLAQAGFEANEILGAMPGTLELAAAAQLDLGTTADLVSNILTGYGRDVEQLSQTNDVLVKTFTETNTNLAQLGDAMKFVGPVASAAGLQFEEVAAAIGLMGNAGLQGEMAGTALRGAIAKILNPSKQAAAVMEELGLTLTDADGKLLSLTEVLTQLAPHADDAGLFLELFGQRAGPGMAALVAQGSGALTDLTNTLENSVGTAADVASVQMQGFNGAMKALRSATEGLLIAFGESGLLDAMTGFVNQVAGIVRHLAETDPALLKMIGGITGLAAVVGPLVVVLGTMATGIAALLTPVGLVVAAIIAAGGLIAAFVLMRDDVTRLVEETVTFIEDWLVGKFRAIVDKAGELVGNVTGFFAEMWEDVVGESFVPDMVTEIGRWFGSLDRVMVKPARDATGKVEQAFGRMAGVLPATQRSMTKANESLAMMGKLARQVETAGTAALKPFVLQDTSFLNLLQNVLDSVLQTTSAPSSAGLAGGLVNAGTEISESLAEAGVALEETGEGFAAVGDSASQLGQIAVDAFSGFVLEGKSLRVVLRDVLGGILRLKTTSEQVATRGFFGTGGDAPPGVAETKEGVEEINEGLIVAGDLGEDLGRIATDAFRSIALEGNSLNDVLRNVVGSLLQMAQAAAFGGGGGGLGGILGPILNFGGSLFGFGGAGRGPDLASSVFAVGGGTPFARGGDFIGGQRMIVGEQGIELMNPNSSGRIFNTEQLGRAIAGGGSRELQLTNNFDLRGSAAPAAELMRAREAIVGDTVATVLALMDAGGDFSKASGRR